VHPQMTQIKRADRAVGVSSTLLNNIIKTS
jgi:hypothetical protein